MILRKQRFDVIYVDPLHRQFLAYTDIGGIVARVSEVVADIAGYSSAKLVELVVYLVNELLKRWRRRVALLADDVFQVIGIEKAEAYVKSLLNIIEYPPEPYEKIVVIVTTSEGVLRARIGRHRWAEVMPMRNVSKKGFEELYNRLPGPKPSFDYVWR